MSKPTHKMFKSRVKKEKPARKRAIEDGDVDDGDAELSLEELRELKEDQKFRERKRLQSDGRKTTTAATEATTSATSDSSLSTLDGQFMTQSADLPVDPFEAIKNKYIEAKLKEKYAPTTTTDSPIISKERSEELELYSIPEHLRHQPTDHSAERGNILSKGSGIPEIELGAVDPAKALEATKEALKGRAIHESHHHSSSTGLPVNMSVNYTQHKVDHLTKPKEGISNDQQLQKD
ncbi:hypothetical protein, variant 1 [Aphanomyces astaci]|uniref:Uncharacterized protein n=1 Tax=Aphanomyces astaci TaxID=112090 RepID=W4H653_APHAT|nr:hypothetical protein, variant 1 [Aphanomyces astaci]ETV87392.1 hypothetical protein, variant 1 [Aphanomyces astaci]|eukprot:XP_009822255.1 hypothetical protein, variant 1 [Aphanomyces astaci]